MCRMSRRSGQCPRPCERSAPAGRGAGRTRALRREPQLPPGSSPLDLCPGPWTVHPLPSFLSRRLAYSPRRGCRAKPPGRHRQLHPAPRRLWGWPAATRRHSHPAVQTAGAAGRGGGTAWQSPQPASRAWPPRSSRHPAACSGVWLLGDPRPAPWPGALDVLHPLDRLVQAVREPLGRNVRAAQGTRSFQHGLGELIQAAG